MQALLQYFKAMLNPGPGVLLFALRTIAAGLLTLYLAFLFDLDQPKWSIMAVVIISQPLGGMVIEFRGPAATIRLPWITMAELSLIHI